MKANPFIQLLFRLLGTRLIFQIILTTALVVLFRFMKLSSANELSNLFFLMALVAGLLGIGGFTGGSFFTVETMTAHQSNAAMTHMLTNSVAPEHETGASVAQIYSIRGGAFWGLAFLITAVVTFGLAVWISSNPLPKIPGVF